MADRPAPPSLLERRWLLGAPRGSAEQRTFDVLVIGSGIAGLTAALHAAQDHSVALLTKAELAEGNTWYAQGGIAGAVGEADSVELHLADTLVVGQGLCDEAVVRAVVAEAPAALRELRELGVRFDLAEDGVVALAREGGHSLPRVLHSGDATGAAVQDTLTSAVRKAEGIAIFEHRFLVDLLTTEGRCDGAVVLNVESGEVEVYRANAVVLATGGAGQAFPVTTNPLIATGDGVAAAWRAGAEVSDLEFVQFHPTALDHKSAPRFLVSEALRGEGAYLLDCDLQRFMVGVHPLAELAPRDVVSREIERVMARCGRENVWLDARHLGADFLRNRFPNIWKACADAGYDLGSELVPVVPAAHYLVGGVHVDVDGRSSLPGLYVSGEAAASGLHGANRLASNSLLEGLVFSRRIVRALAADEVADAQLPAAGAHGPDAAAPAEPRPLDHATAPSSAATSRLDPAIAIAELHKVTGRLVGMSRTAEGLAQACDTIAALGDDVGSPRTARDIEVANLLTVAWLITRAAYVREESRGCHLRLDHPDRDDEHWRRHTVWSRDVAMRSIDVATGASTPNAEE